MIEERGEKHRFVEPVFYFGEIFLLLLSPLIEEGIIPRVLRQNIVDGHRHLLVVSVS